jgi:hypothetical protein
MKLRHIYGELESWLQKTRKRRMNLGGHFSSRMMRKAAVKICRMQSNLDMQQQGGF